MSDGENLVHLLTNANILATDEALNRLLEETDSLDFTNYLLKDLKTDNVFILTNKSIDSYFDNKKDELISKDLYIYIKNFVKKYQRRYKNENFNKLMSLIDFEGININKYQLKYLIEKEIEEQDYLGFKEKVLSKNPNNLDKYVNTAIEIYGENLNPLFYLHTERLFKEKKWDFNLNEIQLIVNKIKKENEISNFKNYLLSDEEFLKIEDIDNFSGHEFEKFLKTLFKKMGYNVELTKRSHDQGADLVINKFGEKTVVQSKRYGNAVGNKAIQEVVAAIGYYNANKGIVVTNNDFTSPAVKLANSNSIILINRKVLKELMDQYPIIKND